MQHGKMSQDDHCVGHPEYDDIPREVRRVKLSCINGALTAGTTASEGLSHTRNFLGATGTMTLPETAADQYLCYSNALEEIEPDEYQTFEKISHLMSQGADTVRRMEGEPLRVSHAKAHGAVTGKLIVDSGLPEYLRQGLFEQPGKRYDVLIRLAHTPGVLVDDRKASTPRGIAIKVVGVNGNQISGHIGTTQDFLLNTGKAFIAPGAKSFLQAVKPNAEIAPHLSDTTEGAISAVARVSNKAVRFFVTEPTQLEFLGHPFLHPLAECYYSQTPFRYGSYVAKFRVQPVTPGLDQLAGQEFQPQHTNGLRTDVVEFFRTHDAQYVFGVQLARNLQDFPIENGNVEWPEDQSPFQRVGRIVIPAQDAYEPEKVEYIEGLSFSPGHTLAAHRPLGSLNRARLYTYAALARKRRHELGVTQIEPDSIAAFPRSSSAFSPGGVRP